MASIPQDHPSPKRNADAISSDPPSPNPSTKRVKSVPTKDSSSPPGPIPDDDDWERGAIIKDRTLQARTQSIKDRVASAAAFEYSPMELAVNIMPAKEMIMENIKNAMVWTSSFESGRESKFLVRFQYDVNPGNTQVLRLLFPGVGVSDGNGKDKGWTMNVYSPADFQDIMGTGMIARVGSSFAELMGAVVVSCPMNEGNITFAGLYRKLKLSSDVVP